MRYNVDMIKQDDEVIAEFSKWINDDEDMCWYWVEGTVLHVFHKTKGVFKKRPHIVYLVKSKNGEIQETSKVVNA